MSYIFMSAPDAGELEAKYVAEALASGWVAPAGPDLAAFEFEMRTRVGRDYAVALSSGTAALHLALIGVGVQPGDVVLTSTLTFAATANAITYVDAEPFFVDSDLETGNVDVELMAQAAWRLRHEGRRIGALLPVDLLGKCADLTALTALADDLGVPLVVDAAESVGASHRGRPSGSFGVASIFSFNGNKIMTTSGGGMLLTDDEALADRARYLSTQARQPVLHYEHVEIGYNYRLSNILAALGRAQLIRLDDMIARRRSIRSAYRSIFNHVPGVRILDGGDDSEDNCWLTSVVVDSNVEWTSQDLRDHLNARQIECRPLWKPMHLQPAYAQGLSSITGSAERLFEESLTLPSGSGLTEADLERIISAITEFIDDH